MNRIKLITTPIFYVNGAPHIGHASTLLLADALARYQRMCGSEVLFVTGTDEHGSKIERAAKAANMQPKEFCDSVSVKFRNLAEQLQLSHDVFIRTSEERHYAAVKRVWAMMDKAGLVRRGKYAGYYSITDEAFVSRVAHCDNGSVVALDSGSDCEWQEEDNYVFPLGEFADRLRAWASQPGVVHPPMRQKEVLQQVLAEDVFDKTQTLSISRVRARNPWGIPVPGDDTQTVYVWLDALVNYLSAVDFADAVEGDSNSLFARAWPPYAQVLGKDIVKFHCSYWPGSFCVCLVLHVSWKESHSHTRIFVR